MNKFGKYYTKLTGSEEGNEKYSVELKKSIEKAGQLCLDNLKNNSFAPIMMMEIFSQEKQELLLD